MKARLGPVGSIVAATVLLVGAAPVAARAQTPRTPNPNAPKLVVGTLRSSDKKMSALASEELRSRLNADIPFRQLTVISSADYKTVVEQSGYPYDESLSPGDLNSLAKLLRTDEYLEGTVEKTPIGFKISASLLLTRDKDMKQPLPSAEGDRLTRAAAAMSKNVQDARKQIDFEKRCNSLGRDGKMAEAIAAARAGVAAYPEATLVRLCELQVRIFFKQAPDSVLVTALEVLKYDPRSKTALTSAAQAYKDKGDEDRATEVLVQLLATDPTNARLVDDVVNALAASGKSPMAKPIIAQAIKDNPGDVRLMKLGFLIYLASGDVKAGTELGEEMVKMDSSLADTSFFVKMAGAHHSDSAFTRAAELAARGVAKFPANLTLLTMLGQEQLKGGQQQQAIATFRKILAMDPKAQNIRMLIARTYDEMQQPDSALITLREAKAAGEDGQAVGGYALSIGNRLFKVGQEALNKAQQTKTSDDYAVAIAENEKVLPWVLFADSSLTVVENKNQAKFLLAVATFQISVAAVSDAPKTKSCPLAKLAAEHILTSQMNITSGGRFAPDVVSQLMPIIPQIMTAGDQMVKQYCK